MLARVPYLGDAEENVMPAELEAKRCAMLDELRALMAQMLESTQAKWAHMLGKIDAALNVSHQANAAGQQ